MNDRQIYPASHARRIISDYVCAKCWGTLMAQIIPGTGNELIFCQTHKESGIVTRDYVDLARKENAIDAIDARRNLEVLFPMQHRTEEEILSDLGF